MIDKLKYPVLILASVLLFAHPVRTERFPVIPLKAPNQIPAYLFFPSVHHLNPFSIGRDEFHISTYLGYSSHYTGQVEEDRFISQLFEMEALYLTLRYGVTDKFTLAAEVPYHNYSKSRFRRLVHTSMEDFFVDVLVVDGRVIYNNGRGTSGLGDVSFMMHYKLTGDGKNVPEVTVFGVVEFPTGSESKGLSNGENDYAAGIALREAFERMGFALSAAVSEPGGMNELGSFEPDIFYSVTGDIMYPIFRGLTGQLQLCWNDSPLGEIDLEKLASDSLYFSLGFKYRFPRGKHVYEFSFTEDITGKAHAQPDYSFNLGAVFRF